MSEGYGSRWDAKQDRIQERMSKHKDEVFDALTTAMENLRIVEYRCKDLNVNQQAHALGTLTLAVQESVRQLDNEDFTADPRDGANL